MKGSSSFTIGKFRNWICPAAAAVLLFAGSLSQTFRLTLFQSFTLSGTDTIYSHASLICLEWKSKWPNVPTAGSHQLQSHLLMISNFPCCFGSFPRHMYLSPTRKVLPALPWAKKCVLGWEDPDWAVWFSMPIYIYSIKYINDILWYPWLPLPLPLSRKDEKSEKQKVEKTKSKKDEKSQSQKDKKYRVSQKNVT